MAIEVTMQQTKKSKLEVLDPYEISTQQQLEQSGGMQTDETNPTGARCPSRHTISTA